jgi:gliding motility-associated-like protein
MSKEVKITLTILSCLCCSLIGVAQLQNESFEFYSSLPTNTGQFSRAIGWSNAGSLYATPDYYNYAANESADIPQTPMGIVNAADGNAVMGFCASGTNGTNFREYLSTHFTAPLEVGKEYTLAFRITCGEMTEVATSGLGVSHLGVHFSTAEPVQIGTDPLNQLPHFRIDTVFYTNNWKHIVFNFTPDQPFRYLTLGVFANDADVTIEQKAGDNAMFAYYFVDDFYLKQVPENYDPTIGRPGRNDGINPVASNTELEATEPFYVPNSFTPNGDNKNDEFIPVAGKINEWELSVFSHWGDKVFCTTDENIGWDGSFQGKPANPGAYVWEISYSEFEDEKGWVKKNKTGVFQLIR